MPVLTATSTAALAVSPSSTDLYWERLAELSLTSATVTCDFCDADLLVSAEVHDLQCRHCKNFTCTPRNIKRLEMLAGR